ncbi:MAG: LuxR C-terminal-related transcriptional regulator [Treponema sp.]|jgi:DNA-binding CsgD family transcriptional regulator|nr:LuxR C-terminal-related transcriptional regulator [Treponema sp.]
MALSNTAAPAQAPLSGRGEYSLSLRLFAFLAVFAAAIFLALALILFSAGVFSLGLTESRVFLENELAHIAGELEGGYGVLSVEGAALSKRLTEQIERELESLNAAPGDLKKTPGLIEPVLRSLMDTLIAALEKNMAGGVYVTLDATVNPSAPGAEHSRAGIAVQNSEPNALNRSSPSLHYLKGPASLGREWGLFMRPQWTMEFTVSPGDFWYETVKFARAGMDISRLYYWVPALVPEGDFREVVRLCVPMRASDGTPLGVCGFDVNGMLFKLQNAPDNGVHQRVFSLFGPVEAGNAPRFDASRSLIAANQGTRFRLTGVLSAEESRGGLPLFTGQDGTRYAGLWRTVKLYPSQAVHGGQRWAAAVMMPQSDLDNYVMRKNRGILALLSVLLAFSIAAAIPLSRRCLAPVYHAIDRLKEKGVSDYEKTHIREIDDLFAFLAERDELAAQNGPAGEGEKAPAVLTQRFNTFLRNLAALSKAERSVFNLYAKNYSAKEIAYTLCLSMNTIKTHNKRIYAKLGVTSRKEMMVYVDMMTGGEALD